MRNWGDVLNAADFDACCLQCTNSSFTACARSFDENVSGTHSLIDCNLSSLFSCHLCCEWCALTRAFESESASGCPSDGIAVGISNRYDRVVESSFLLALLFTVAMLSLLQHYFLVAVFLPAMVFFGPLRVRALVFVRCPRVGSPAR